MNDIDSAPAEKALPPAGLFKRLFAMLYDSLLVLAIIMLGTALAIALRVWFSGADIAVNDPDTAAHGLLFQAWLLFLGCGFFVYFWRRTGQTLGMQAWRLKICNSDGSLISIKQCFLRLLGGVLSWLCLGLGYWQIAFRSDGASWSDLLSDSRCAQLPKR